MLLVVRMALTKDGCMFFCFSVLHFLFFPQMLWGKSKSTFKIYFTYGLVKIHNSSKFLFLYLNVMNIIFLLVLGRFWWFFLKNKLKQDWYYDKSNFFLMLPPLWWIFSVCILMVGCPGAVQLGGIVLGSSWLVPLRLRLVSLFYSLKRSTTATTTFGICNMFH